ncbi:hypothetical protein [Rhodoplanes sp. Z2-YC6860]|uniref:hypothetical protein n=1 Tax=Rhodoplanes sp. Z2-YC6860 TaxID=674703 RepID=UPI0012ED9A42|nr:hypothetical protein [Rhodoplanes sp. Z2-YC6860]
MLQLLKSVRGTSRRFAATAQYCRFQTKADIATNLSTRPSRRRNQPREQNNGGLRYANPPCEPATSFLIIFWQRPDTRFDPGNFVRMSDKASHLRLVSTADVGGFDHADGATPQVSAGAMRAEANDLAARIGKKPHSDSLLKSKRGLDREQATVIGRIINKRGGADEKSLLPEISPAQKTKAKIARKYSRKRLSTQRQLTRLVSAVRTLAELTEAPPDLVGALSPHLDKPVIVENLEAAVRYLDRFAKEWHRHEQTSGMD